MPTHPAETSGIRAAPAHGVQPGAPAPWRRPLLVVHIAASVSVVGADLGLLVLGISGRSGTDPLTIYPAMRMISAWLVAPLAVVALGTGLILATTSRWGLLGYWWVTIKLAVTATLTALVLFALVPGLGRAADSAEGLSTAALLTDTQRLIYAIIPAIATILLLLNVTLAVYKPAWRTPSRHRPARQGSPV